MEPQLAATTEQLIRWCVRDVLVSMERSTTSVSVYCSVQLAVTLKIRSATLIGVEHVCNGINATISPGSAI